MLATDWRYGISEAARRPLLPVSGARMAHGAAIENETIWRWPPGLDGPGLASVIASRWRGPESQRREVSATSAAGYHTIAIALRRMTIVFTSEGRLRHDGPVMPGTVQVSRPGERVGAVFDGAFDMLHLFVPEDLLADCREAAGDWAELADPGFTQDAVIERLAQALLQAEDAGEFGKLYAETLSLAIVSRLLGLQNARGQAPSGARAGLLPKWRLRRVTQFVDAHLDQSLSLADLAQVAGLSRMHFAAQFRAATSFRPHEYILRRRIEHAQDRLASTAEPLVEVAMSVGFRTQAHFSTVFKRFAGTTPLEWRRQARPISLGRS